MVIVQIKGGLGNQMFQYAFALWLKAHGKKVKLDTSYYKKDHRNDAVDTTHNGFELERVFDCRLPMSTKDENDMLIHDHPDFFHKVLWKALGVRPSHVRILNTLKWYFPEFKEKDNCYFDGYWVSFRYADEIAQKLRKAFEFKTNLSEKNHNILKEIENTNSVSLHIRHGDYLNISKYIKIRYITGRLL